MPMAGGSQVSRLQNHQGSEAAEIDRGSSLERLRRLSWDRRSSARDTIFSVTGLSATGRSTAVKSILEGMRLKGTLSMDRCYVNNFKSPDEPRLLTLPRGKGEKLSRDMAKTVDTLKITVPHALEDETVLERKRALTEEFAKKEADLFKELEAKVAVDGFALVQVQMGPYTRPDIFPLIDGNPVPPNQVGQAVEEGKFPKEKLDDLYKRSQVHKSNLRSVMKQVRDINRQLEDKTSEIDREVLEEVLKDYCEEICEKYPYPGVQEYMMEAREFIIANPDIFSPSDDSQQRPPIPPIPGLMVDDAKPANPFRLFQVNVVRDAAKEDPTPVVVEPHPSFLNLFGTIEREMRFGGYYATDFTMIRAGSLLRADGGFLVLNVVDVLTEPLVWRTLIRTLKTGKLQIQGLETVMSMTMMSLKPQPIDLNVTVILIGEAEMYNLLSFYEEDFHRISKSGPISTASCLERRPRSTIMPVSPVRKRMKTVCVISPQTESAGSRKRARRCRVEERS